MECATPPIEHNFIGQPICKHGPYDFQINQTEKAAFKGRQHESEHLTTIRTIKRITFTVWSNKMSNKWE